MHLTILSYYITYNLIILGQTWHQLENVAADEGNSVGDYSGKTLEQCWTLCALKAKVGQCASFAYAYQGVYQGNCHLKDKTIDANEPQKVVPGFRTYYMS